MSDQPVSMGPLSRARRGVARRLRSIKDGLHELAWWNLPPGRATHRHLAALRGKYAGRRAWVFGGGPSLRRTDVRLLRDEVTIASNAIFLIFPEMGYRPTFLTVEDWLVAEDRQRALNDITGITKIFPRDLRRFLRPDADTLYINFLRDYPGFPRFSERFEDRVYWGGTVTMLNLQLAFHLGCDPVYLIGFDHEYKLPADQAASVVITSKVEDSNHFHPDYFGPGFRWHDPVLSRMEAAYRVAGQHFAAAGRRIVNATDGGRLEVFPREAFHDVLAADRPS